MTHATKTVATFVFTLVLMGSVASTFAQSSTTEYPKFEFFAGYSALGEANSPGISFGPNAAIGDNYAAGAGFETSLIGNFNKHFGIKGDFSAHFRNADGRGPLAVCNPTCITVTQDNHLKTRVYNFLAGPEFKARNSTRFTPFAYAPVGVGHTSATFTTPGPTLNLFLKNSSNGFAMALGGGLDVRASKRVSFRGSMDYNPVFDGDANSGARDLVRISLGLLFH
jgi:opacity protein-like surface antigen